jgi:ribosomal-protein-alanine N-acetyltransferase
VSAQPQELWRLHPMHPSHLSQVLEIERQTYEFPWSEGVFEDCLRVGYSAWVLTNTLGEVLGYALMSMAVGEAHVLNICVAPEQRRRGMARFLMRHLLMIARAADVTLMLLEVRRSNRGGQRLYEELGFRKLGERKAYYPAREGREDALVLGLDL